MTTTQAALWTQPVVAATFDPAADVVVAPGDCLETLQRLPDAFAQLIVTSPPYNLGKAYEAADDIELVERCVLAFTNEGDWVLDPFAGVGSSLLAALRHKRRALGCEKDKSYNAITHQRIADFANGTLRYRALGKPIYQPTGREKVSQVPAEWLQMEAIV